MERDLFKPAIVLVAYSLFMLLVLFSVALGLDIPTPSLKGFLIIIITFPVFMLGKVLADKWHSERVPLWIQIIVLLLIISFYSLVFSNFFSISLMYSIVLISLITISGYLLVLRYRNINSPWKIPLILTVVGISMLILTFADIGGIPILNINLRVFILTNVFWGVAVLTFFLGYPLLLPRLKGKTMFLLIALFTFLFMLSAFRTAIVAVLLTGVIIAYYSKKLNNKTVLLPLLAILFLILAVGYVSSPTASPENLFLQRVGSTYTVFDSIVEKSLPAGYTYGALLLQGNPRDFMGEFMGYGGNLTYTLLGQPVLDFGIPGALLAMFLFGFVLQLAYKSMKEGPIFMGMYPLLLSMTLVWIETGIDQLHLVFFFAFLVLYISRSG